MKTLINLCLLSFLVYTPTDCSAQFLKKLKKAVTEAVEEKTIEKVADEVSDDVVEELDKVFEEDKSGSTTSGNKSSQQSEEVDNEEASRKMNNLLGGIMTPAKTEDSYSFPISITYDVTDEKGKKRQFKQSYSTNAIAQSMEGIESIIDFENESIILLNEEEKSAQPMSMKWMKKMGMSDYMLEDVNDVDTQDWLPTKTGKTRKILGYSCEEYELKNEDQNSKIWISKEVDFNYKNYIMGINKMLGSESLNTPMYQDNGCVLAMISYDKKGEVEMEMEVIDISQKVKEVKMSNYEIKSMGQE